jgi:4a-hydroxytetrahydrobiopterin dehydratase
MSTQLAERHCRACRGDILRLEDPQQLAVFSQQISQEWEIIDGKKLRREWKVRNFAAGMDFLNKVAAIAEAENHHPEIHLTAYQNITLELWTHSVGALTENDFIMAAKIDKLQPQLSKFHKSLAERKKEKEGQQS